MKELTNMVNTDKASVFFDLFKTEIPALILYLQNQSKAILHKPAEIYEIWESDFGSIEIWKKLATSCQDIIENNGDKLWNFKGNFQLLFQDYLSKYTIFWLRNYVLQQTQHPKLTIGFKLLFE